MLVNVKKIIWIPAILILFGGIVNFVHEFFVFLTPAVSIWISRVGGGILSLIMLVELSVWLRDKFITHIHDPHKKIKEAHDRINSERERIRSLLNFEYEGKSIEVLQQYKDKINRFEFSKESLAPYTIQWFDQIQGVNDILEEEYKAIELERFENDKKLIQQEIDKLKEEKQQLLASDEEKKISKKEEFFAEEIGDLLHIHAEYLEQEQKEWLSEEGFKLGSQWCIEHKKSEEFFIKTRFNEGESHAYLTSAIYKYVKEEDPEATMPTTRDADIVFHSAGISFAIEVETGKVYEKSKKKLQEKVDSLNEKYKEDGWFFVVTNKNLLSKYKQFGKAVVRNNVMDEIDYIFYPDGFPEESTP
tara:strand:+ start:14826 stop:15905 length:1080 start_codon:yes stop_codon:yes gene_type:complete